MSSIGELASKAKEVLVSIGSTPQPEDPMFVKITRSAVLWMCGITLLFMGCWSAYKGDGIIGTAVIASVTVIAQQFGSQRTDEKKAAFLASTEDKKTITGAATIDKQTAATASSTDKQTAAIAGE